MSDDEYSVFDLSEFTEDDFKQLDAEVEHRVPNCGSKSRIEPPNVLAAGEQILDTKLKGKQRRPKLSPYDEFRHGGVLAVTDLAAPSWCEVQFDYGLRQKRSRPLSNRPKSFRSAQGKEISVEETVAIKNDEITKQGKAIHKELEREIGLDEVLVDITSDEERWALRLVNILACLKVLLMEGRIREMPVFGMFNNQVIVGIIDEVESKPHKETPAAMHITEQSTSKEAHDAFTTTEATPSTANVGPELSTPTTHTENLTMKSSQPQAHVLHLVDTKSRRSNSLPRDEDTLSSRIQLMLYYRLLRDLLSIERPFDFSFFWDTMRLNASKPFSTKFIIQAGLVGNEAAPTCLDSLARTWIDLVHGANIRTLDSNLKLIYRLQPSTQPRKKRGREKPQVTPDLGLSLEENDLAQAIEASLYTLREEKMGIQPMSRLNPPSDQVPEPHMISDVPKYVEPKAEIDLDDMTIIGTKEFIYSEKMLDEQLHHVLQWWHGERKPQGVSLEESRRCFSCEYEAHCEWREEKAAEFKDQRKIRQIAW